MGIPQNIQFASLGMADSLILMVLALVVFGPRRLPQIGRQIGKLMYEFRKASNDFKFQMEEELRNAEESDLRQKEEERLKTLALAPAVEPATEAATGETVPAASPYPWESVYPPVPAPIPEAVAEAIEPLPEAIVPAEGSALEAEPAMLQTEGVTAQIQPPSTAETVAADRPRRIRRKRTPKLAAVEETITDATGAAVEEPQAAEAKTADVAPPDQAGTVSGKLPEQVNG
jgi:sec-independent protein translocase protein TatB